MGRRRKAATGSKAKRGSNDDMVADARGEWNERMDARDGDGGGGGALLVECFWESRGCVDERVKVSQKRKSAHVHVIRALCGWELARGARPRVCCV